jgi:hypothetical protein
VVGERERNDHPTSRQDPVDQGCDHHSGIVPVPTSVGSGRGCWGWSVPQNASRCRSDATLAPQTTSKVRTTFWTWVDRALVKVTNAYQSPFGADSSIAQLKSRVIFAAGAKGGASQTK